MANHSAPDASDRGRRVPCAEGEDALCARMQELEQDNNRLREELRRRSTFLASMSHEMKAPLNAINGFTELLSDPSFGPMTDEQRGFVSRVHEAGNHLLQLVNDIIDIARVDADRLAVDPQPISANHCVEQAVLIGRGMARDKSIRIETVTDATQPVAMADDRRVKQVLFNLLSNAVKYSDPETLVTVRVQREEGFVRVSVQDEGIGVGREDQERIFEVFERAEGADERAEGSGLGLPLSQRLVQLQGGEMGVKSAPGRGSEFWFTLPLAVRPE